MFTIKSLTGERWEYTKYHDKVKKAFDDNYAFKKKLSTWIMFIVNSWFFLRAFGYLIGAKLIHLGVMDYFSGEAYTAEQVL